MSRDGPGRASGTRDHGDGDPVGVATCRVFRLSPLLTALALTSGLVLVAVVWPLVRRSRRFGQELLTRNRGVQALATGFLDALKLTKAYGAEEEHVSAYSAALAAARDPQIGFARISALAAQFRRRSRLGRWR